MLHLLLRVDLVVLSKILDDIYVETVFHDESSCPRCLSVAASLIDRLEHRQIVLAAAVVVVFTECRGRMNDSGTIFSADIIHTSDYKGVLSVLDLAERLDLLIGPVLHVTSFDLIDHFVFLAGEHLICESLSYPKEIPFVFAGLHEAHHVIDVRAYCQRNVGRECPWSCGPCEEVLVVMIDTGTSELACECIDLYILIALSYLVRSKTCSAARAVRQDLVSLVNKALIESILDDPPACFDVVVFICDIRIFHISEVSHFL